MDIPSKLLNHFRASGPDACIDVVRRLAKYPDYLEEYTPNVPFQKLLDGYELYIDENQMKDKTGFVGNSAKFLEDNVERSIRRTKKQINDYIQCNDFDVFGTFTFKADIDLSLTVMREVDQQWLISSPSAKERFQNTLFPNGLVYDYENGKFGTNQISAFYRYAGSKKGTEVPSKSFLVAGAGLEPATLWL